MSAVLLLLAPDREASDAIERALQIAEQQETSLHATYIIDPEAVRRLHRAVGQRGWVGEDACDKLCASIQTANEERARELLDSVQAAARSHHRACATDVVTGPFVQTALDAIARSGAVQVVVARRPGYRFRQLVRSSDVDALKRAAPCPVIDMEPGAVEA